MKYCALYNTSNGCVAVHSFDPANSADDPCYGYGFDWSSTGYFNTPDEALRAAEQAAEEEVSRVVIRREASSPADPDNYALIRTFELIPDGWFAKEIVDSLDMGYKFIDNQTRWCIANGIG